jgi:hypothetical protein
LVFVAEVGIGVSIFLRTWGRASAARDTRRLQHSVFDHEA